MERQDTMHLRGYSRKIALLLVLVIIAFISIQPTAANQGSDPVDMKASTDSIFSEIKKLKRQHGKLSAVAERPARIGGRFRSVSNTSPKSSRDISHLAKEVSSTQYYSRTFTIDHQ
jgi:hypothetical protein